MAPGPKTTWENLFTLGWPKQQVYDTLNRQRNYTMEGIGDIALNEGFATDWSWYCYNVLHGEPYSEQPAQPTQHTTDEGIAWQYDNTRGRTPFQTTVTETWDITETATLSITSRASIELGAFINVYGVAGSNLSIGIETESTEQKSKQQSYTLSHTWTITVPPGKHVSIRRTKKTSTQRTNYHQAFGLWPQSLIATKGKQFNGHYYWGFNANRYLGSPGGTMVLGGESKLTTFEFVMHEIILHRTAPVLYPLYTGTPDAVEVAESGNEAQVIYGVPGDISRLAPEIAEKVLAYVEV